MVEMSSMKITAGMNVDEIKQAFGFIHQSMKNTQKDSKTTSGDLKRLELGVSVLGKAVMVAGTAFTGMLYEASRKAPALAGSMASIKTSWDSMIRSLGEGLAPIFDWLSVKMEGLANWASGHPDLFATVIGGVATTAALAGLVKILGLGAALNIAAGALAPFLLPVVAGSILAGLLILAAIKVGDAISEPETLIMNVPIPEAAKDQIIYAKSHRETGEYLDLVNRYAITTDHGAQSTPEIDPTTGRLVSSKTMSDRAIRAGEEYLKGQNWTITTRNWAMNSTDSYSSTGSNT